MRCWLFLLLFPVIASAQQPLQLVIDTILVDDSDALVRKFDIRYHITNTTNRPLSFYLDPETTIANAASSMTLHTVYKIYQNGVFQDMDGPFFPDIPERSQLDALGDYKSAKAQAYIKLLEEKYRNQRQQMLANYKNSGGTQTNEDWIIKNQTLLQSRRTLAANQTLHFSIPVRWNRIRLVTTGDVEYYLNEHDTYEIQLVLDLKKTAFQDWLDASECNQIQADPNFIEGLFVSNKIRLDFHP